MRSVLSVHWEDWCWSWNSNTSRHLMQRADSFEKTLMWERLRAGGEGDDRGWDGWMASLTRWSWVWVNSGNWWWTGRPGVLRFMGSQSIGQDWATELNWTEPHHNKNHIWKTNSKNYTQWRKTENFPLRSVTRQGDFLTISIQYSYGRCSQSSQAKEARKGKRASKLERKK